ncbi:MAG TPA: hypothetical protein VGK96_13475 [Candidatus Sulfotelmatobacter sp.]
MLVSLWPLLAGAQQTAVPAKNDSSMQSQPQDPAKDPAAPPAQQAPADKDKKTPSTTGKVAGTSNDRLFYTLPNFLSLETTRKLPPMTTKQKYAVVARSTFDYVQYPWWAFLSGISQAENSEPGYGQGWGAYGKRFATAVADGTIENFMTGAVLPSLLHQDPRFYQSSEGGFKQRAWYAVSRIFVTRADSGATQFNYSEIVGSAMSASISTFSYHPRSTYISTPSNPRQFVPSDRTLANAANVWGSQVGYDTITIVVKEFWPDIHRKLSKKHSVIPGSTAP